MPVSAMPAQSYTAECVLSSREEHPLEPLRENHQLLSGYFQINVIHGAAQKVTEQIIGGWGPCLSCTGGAGGKTQGCLLPSTQFHQ